MTEQAVELENHGPLIPHGVATGPGHPGLDRDLKSRLRESMSEDHAVEGRHLEDALCSLDDRGQGGADDGTVLVAGACLECCGQLRSGEGVRWIQRATVWTPSRHVVPGMSVRSRTVLAAVVTGRLSRVTTSSFFLVATRVPVTRLTVRPVTAPVMIGG